MIAPLRLSSKPRAKALGDARRLVAQLLPSVPPRLESVPNIKSWQAWLYALWVVIATGAYFWTMLH